MRAKTNIGMVQIFATFGLAILMRGLAQYFFTPDYRSIRHSWLGGETVSIGGVFLPVPQTVGGLISVVVFGGLYFLIRGPISARRSKRRARMRARSRWSASTGTASSRSAGASARRSSGSRAPCWRCSFTSIREVGATFALIAYVTVALGGFGSVFGALAGRHHRRPRRGA